MPGLCLGLRSDFGAFCIFACFDLTTMMITKVFEIYRIVITTSADLFQPYSNQLLELHRSARVFVSFSL